MVVATAPCVNTLARLACLILNGSNVRDPIDGCRHVNAGKRHSARGLRVVTTRMSCLPFTSGALDAESRMAWAFTEAGASVAHGPSTGDLNSRRLPGRVPKLIKGAVSRLSLRDAISIHRSALA